MLLLTDSESVLPVRRASDRTVAFAEGRGDGLLRIRLINLGLNPLQVGRCPSSTSGAGGYYRPGVAVAVLSELTPDGGIARLIADPSATNYVMVEPIYEPLAVEGERSARARRTDRRGTERLMARMASSGRRGSYGSGINRAGSPLRASTVPYVTIVLGSVLPVLFLADVMPIVPPLGYLFPDRLAHHAARFPAVVGGHAAGPGGRPVQRATIRQRDLPVVGDDDRAGRPGGALFPGLGFLARLVSRPV